MAVFGFLLLTAAVLAINAWLLQGVVKIVRGKSPIATR